MKNCKYCAEEIKDEAILCRYCGKKQHSISQRIVKLLDKYFREHENKTHPIGWWICMFYIIGISVPAFIYAMYQDWNVFLILVIFLVNYGIVYMIMDGDIKGKIYLERRRKWKEENEKTN